jgi:anti-sigma-K factor RskA
MDRFLRSTPDAVTLPLAGAAAGFEKATGEVVWSDQQQTGYFRIADLAPNDPAQAQYQLWIVDPTRDSKPVDGGVFDITPGQNVVKIHAKLHVDKPAIFAITKEKPGGVVVSAGPLLVVAKR